MLVREVFVLTKIFTGYRRIGISPFYLLRLLFVQFQLRLLFFFFYITMKNEDSMHFNTLRCSMSFFFFFQSCFVYLFSFHKNVLCIRKSIMHRGYKVTKTYQYHPRGYGQVIDIGPF